MLAAVANWIDIRAVFKDLAAVDWTLAGFATLAHNTTYPVRGYSWKRCVGSNTSTDDTGCALARLAPRRSRLWELCVKIRMKIIDTYIRRSVLMGILLVMLVLMPLVSFLLLSSEMDHVGKGQYTLLNAFVFIGLALPRYAFQILPIGALIGSLWGLGNLATHSELTAMRIAGISMAQIVYAVLKAGLVVTLISVMLGEVIAPVSDEKGSQMRAEALSESIVLKTRYGFWVRDGRAFINIREILPGGRLRSIFIYEFDDEQRLKLSTYAKAAFYTGDSWRLEGIRQSEFVETSVKTRASRQAVWDSLLDPGMLSLLVVDPHILPAWDLYRYIRFMEDNGLNATSYQVAFWTKMAMPLIIMAMMALTVPMLFGALRTVGVGQRIFIGIIIGIAFYLLSRAFAQLAVVHPISPILAALLPGILCFATVVWLFRRAR